jgi:hypothetical protein
MLEVGIVTGVILTIVIALITLLSLIFLHEAHEKVLLINPNAKDYSHIAEFGIKNKYSSFIFSNIIR